MSFAGNHIDMPVFTTSRSDQERCRPQRRARSAPADQPTARRELTATKSDLDAERQRTIHGHAHIRAGSEVGHRQALHLQSSRQIIRAGEGLPRRHRPRSNLERRRGHAQDRSVLSRFQSQ